jgi:hypothetical protein
MSSQSAFAYRTRHPYRADCVQNLPDGLRRSAEGARRPDDPIRDICVIPSQLVPRKLRGFGGVRHIPEQALVFTTQGILHIIDANSPEHLPEVTYMSGNDLIYARLSIALLYGRLELCSVSGEASKGIIVEYNTVRHDLIQPGLIDLLQLACKPVLLNEPSDRRTSLLLDKLEEKSLKFRNGLENYALQPQEQMSGYVYQPRLTRSYAQIFTHLIAPAGVIALTDRKLIMVEEGRGSATSYGWYFTFCPRTNITGIEVRPHGALVDLDVNLSKDMVSSHHLMTLGAEIAREWQALWVSQA